MRAVVLSAPSGSGKTTIARRLLEAVPELRFSISATTRPPRDSEEDGRDYYFFSTEHFRKMVSEGAFVEWEEVYPGILYGTLRAELERISRDGVALLDVDVKGALSVKRDPAVETLLVFIRPPSLSSLADRLEKRQTETPASLAERLQRARSEMGYAGAFDVVIVNDDLEGAVRETVDAVRHFLTAGAESAASG